MKLAFTERILQDFSENWTKYRTSQISLINDTIRQKLDAALALIVFNGANIMCHIRYRLTKEKKRHDEETDKERGSIWDKVGRANVNIAAKSESEVIDWMLDQYIDKIYEYCPTF